MKLLNIIPFISLILCFSCINETNKIEELKEELPVIEPFTRYSSKNVLLEEGILKDGKRNGEWTYYDDKGKLKKVENYIDDTLDGVYKEYYNNGEIHIGGFYSNGKKDKKWIDYSKKGIRVKEHFYNQDSLICELHYLAFSMSSDGNAFNITRPIYYSDFIPELPYYTVWFNAKLDGQLFVDGQKVIDFKKGEEIELLIEESEFTYSYRYSNGGPHRLDMQIDSIVLSKECEEYLVLVEDSVINKSIYDNKINELLTFLNDPVESNYNYDWNQRKHEFTVDSLSIEVLNQVYKKRQEVTINELNNFIKDTTVSDFKELWFYESYFWDNNKIDSLTLLAYYTKNEIGFFPESEHEHETFVNRTDIWQDLDTLNYNEINCFLSESGDTLLFGHEYCSFESFLKKWNLDNGEERYLNQFYILFEGLRINDFEFDLFFSGPEGCADGDESYMRIKNSEGEMRVLEVSRDYGHESYGYFISSRITFDGKFEITVHEYENIYIEFENNQRAKFQKNYNLVLDYELDDQMDLVFRGIREIKKNRYY